MDGGRHGPSPGGSRLPPGHVQPAQGEAAGPKQLLPRRDGGPAPGRGDRGARRAAGRPHLSDRLRPRRQVRGGSPGPADAGPCFARTRAFRHLLLTLSRPGRGREGNDRRARLQRAAVLPHRSAAGAADRLRLRRHDLRLRPDVELRRPGDARGPLGDRGLHPRASDVAARADPGDAGERPRGDGGTGVAGARGRQRPAGGGAPMNGTAAMPLAPAAYAPPGGLALLRRGAFAVGAAAAAASLLGAWLDPGQFFRSYLVAFLYWLSIALGCSAIAMLHHLTRGGCGLMIMRVLEAASGTLPLVALFFVPLLFGLPDLYRWARPEEVRADALLRHQAVYLNAPFFIARAALYFAIWCGFAWALGRLSARQDATGEPALLRRMQMIAAPGLVLYCLTATFASIDWLMSLDSRWCSTIYGVYFVGGHAIAALSFSVLVALYLSTLRPMRSEEHTSELQSPPPILSPLLLCTKTS